MSLERVEVVGKDMVLTPDEIIEGLQRPGVVDYQVYILYLNRQISKLVLWIDPEVRVRVETEITELLQSVNDTYVEDTKYHDNIQEGKF